MSKPHPLVSNYFSALAKRKRFVTPAMLEQRRTALVRANQARQAKKQAKLTGSEPA